MYALFKDFIKGSNWVNWKNEVNNKYLTVLLIKSQICRQKKILNTDGDAIKVRYSKSRLRNEDKNKYNNAVSWKRIWPRQYNILLKGNIMEQVQSCIYLGTYF